MSDEKITTLCKKVDNLAHAVHELDRNNIAIAADVQATLETFVTQQNVILELLRRPDSLDKLASSTPGVKADGTLKDAACGSQADKPDKGNLKKKNIREFFKGMFCEDQAFREKYTRPEGTKAYEELCEKDAYKKKKPDELLRCEANCHYGVLTKEEKNMLTADRKQIEENLALQKLNETPALTKDEPRPSLVIDTDI
ncbi:hypothetical protein KDA11_01855 [Candidatus Saccharibacteria bacterium]|nr:hypothetical protein [Candidatus Saccharibacteria bacterium]